MLVKNLFKLMAENVKVETGWRWAGGLWHSSFCGKACEAPEELMDLRVKEIYWPEEYNTIGAICLELEAPED